MNNLCYLYYVLFNYIILFVTYISLLMLSGNKVIQLLLCIVIVFFLFKKENIVKNFFIFEKIGADLISNNEKSIKDNVLLSLKKIIILIIGLYILYMKLNEILLILIVLDVCISLTLEISLLEYYFDRKIFFKTEVRGGINEN